MTHYQHHCKRITTNAVVDVVVTETAIPVTEPVALQEVKDYLRVSTTADDVVITEMITEARIWVERRCGISVIPKEVNAILEVMNSQELPYGPILEFDSIIIIDENEDVVSDPNIIGLPGGYPSLNGYGRFTLSYDAGYAICPQDLKQAIKAAVAFNYENRGDELDKSTKPYAEEARRKSNPYKRTIGF